MSFQGKLQVALPHASAPLCYSAWFPKVLEAALNLSTPICPNFLVYLRLVHWASWNTLVPSPSIRFSCHVLVRLCPCLSIPPAPILLKLLRLIPNTHICPRLSLSAMVALLGSWGSPGPTALLSDKPSVQPRIPSTPTYLSSSMHFSLVTHACTYLNP